MNTAGWLSSRAKRLGAPGFETAERMTFATR
jgi:hypothetical protein